MKAVADKISKLLHITKFSVIKCKKLWEKVLQKVENIVRKGENVGYQCF